jgi:tripeptide aminopeptidase
VTRGLTIAAALLLTAATAVRQDAPAALGERLLQDAAVRAALAAVRANEAQVIADQIRFCEVPAPVGHEAARAEMFRRTLEGLGLRHVRIDGIGNVLGERPGLAPRPQLVFTAHLDTVFPEGTDVRVTRDGNVLKGPGIADDCRGLAVVAGVIRALNQAHVETPGTITFAATVGEEGLGNIRGAKYLFSDELHDRIDRFVSVDGAETARIAHVAIGSRRYRVTVKGPGGHSYLAFGLPNPIQALGRAMAKIDALQVPSDPKTTFNVGRIGGGTSINSIPFEAWMEIDMRSADGASLRALEANVLRAIDEALTEANARWPGGPRLTVVKELAGDRPPGRLPVDAPIVQTALSVARAVGHPAKLMAMSGDSNAAITLGVPGIMIDGGGHSAGEHSLAETYDVTDSWKGTAWATLLAIALAQR